jgi:hypothetical protein
VAGWSVYHISYDYDHDLLYISTRDNGVSVIDTHGNSDPSDDSLLTVYNSTSSPTIANNDAFNSFVDAQHNLIYISLYGGGLSVINTKGTLDPSDDELIKTYTNTTSPAIGEGSIPHSFLDSDNNLLYVSSRGSGLTVINTQGTIDPSDDIVKKIYTVTSNPAIISNDVFYSFIDFNHNLLYVSTTSGLSVIYLNEEYNNQGEFISQPLEISAIYTSDISFESFLPENTNINIQTRAGENEVIWENNFDDNSTSEYVGDYYGWGEPFNDAEESNGTMELSNPTAYTYGDDQWVDFWFNLGQTFPAGSTVKARVKINSNKEKGTYDDYMFDDDWWTNSDPLWKNNEWEILRFTTNESFSYIGFDINWKTGTWDNNNDSFEIDWIKIETPITWDSWSSECTNQYGCPVADTTGKTYLQYKLNLSTTDTSVTPVVNSVTLASGYPSSGVYTSKIFDANLNSKWETLSAESTIPTNTSISYQTRSGNTPTPDSSWSDWTDISGSTITSPSNRYLQVKATLATTDGTETPTLSAMTIDYTNLSVGPVLPLPASNNNQGNSNITPPITNETNTPTNTTSAATNGTSNSTNTTTPGISMLDNILNEAKILATKDTSLLLNHLGIQADITKEQAGLTKYQTILDLDKTISNEAKLTINDFMVYGTLSTLRLGAGERAAVINSYYRAYSRLPDSEAEWSDALKIANGRWPNERNSNIENQAKIEFYRVYGRNPEMTNNIDQNTIMVMAYGLMPLPRNLNNERIAITTFRWVYGHNPVSALAWNIVRAVAYSGAGR